MIKSREKTVIYCKNCDKQLKIRNDYAKKHTGYCQSCRKKEDWKNEEYRKKCSESHKGKRSGRCLPHGESSFNNLFYIYKKNAEYREVFWGIDKDYFREITKGNCYYCGTEPLQFHIADKSSNGGYIYNGIDRKNDDLGYTKGNVVSCCKICNYAKQGLTDIEFIAHIEKIYNYKVDTMGSRQITTK